MRMKKIVSALLACVCQIGAASANLPAGSGIDRGFFDGLLRIPSRCGDESQLVRVVEFTRQWLENRGVYCVVETNDVGRVALYASTRPGKVQDYLFVSHLDVVAAPDSMFVPKYEGDKVYARGACDTKGNAVVMCQVLANLAKSGASVGMFLATDEDGGRRGQVTAAMMIQRGYIPRKLVIVGDSAGEASGQLFTAEKGHSHIDLIAHGKGGHSSRPWALDNPIPKLCEGYVRFAKAWEAAQTAGGDDTWRTVVSPTTLKGSNAQNAIPDQAVMHLSCRYITLADYKKVVKMLKEETGLEVRATPGRLPVENRPGNKEIANLLEAMKKKLPGGIREGRMSAATDASFYAATRRPIVIFAADGGEPHCDREWGSLQSLDDYTRFFTEYLKNR